jgi:hypothetical protein
MSASASGIFTLLALVFCGPCLYAIKDFCQSGRYGAVKPQEPHDPHDPSDPSNYKPNDEERLQMKSTEYLFALIGYAIGIGNGEACYAIPIFFVILSLISSLYLFQFGDFPIL